MFLPNKKRKEHIVRPRQDSRNSDSPKYSSSLIFAIHGDLSYSPSREFKTASYGKSWYSNNQTQIGHGRTIASRERGHEWFTSPERFSCIIPWNPGLFIWGDSSNGFFHPRYKNWRVYIIPELIINQQGFWTHLVTIWLYVTMNDNNIPWIIQCNY